jgi:putative Mg2+ transporter-C (MgtC) family protein
LYVDGGSDPTRIAAQVVTGVGFLGAGVILRDRGRITGLTTAATLWATAAVGLAVAYGMYILGLVSTAIILLLLSMRRFLPSLKDSARSFDSD